jgi:single-strand DNA-binding protein
MASLNRVMIIGRLGADPELRFTQNNTAVANLRIATDESWTDRQSGERKEATEWHRVVVFGKQAESCDKFLKKGRLVFVDGCLQTREWQDREGNKRYTTEIRALRVQFLDRGGDAAPKSSTDEPPPYTDADAKMDEGFSDDEIPF